MVWITSISVCGTMPGTFRTRKPYLCNTKEDALYEVQEAMVDFLDIPISLIPDLISLQTQSHGYQMGIYTIFGDQDDDSIYAIKQGNTVLMSIRISYFDM